VALDELKNVITAGTEAEVAHEALIRHWQTLRTWVRDRRPDLLVRQGLASDAQSWSRRGRPPDALRHRGAILDRALKSHPELTLNQDSSGCCLLAGVYVLDFLPCLMGLAATAAARLARSLIQVWRAFWCLETTAMVILRFLWLGAFVTLMRCAA